MLIQTETIQIDVPAKNVKKIIYIYTCFSVFYGNHNLAYQQSINNVEKNSLAITSKMITFEIDLDRK